MHAAGRISNAIEEKRTGNRGGGCGWTRQHGGRAGRAGTQVAAPERNPPAACRCIRTLPATAMLHRPDSRDRCGSPRHHPRNANTVAAAASPRPADEAMNRAPAISPAIRRIWSAACCCSARDPRPVVRVGKAAEQCRASAATAVAVTHARPFRLSATAVRPPHVTAIVCACLCVF